MKLISEQDYDYLINKYHDTNKPFNPYERRAYHGYDYDKSTGLSDEEILEGLLELEKELEDFPHPVAKAKAIEYVLKNTRIDVNERDYFIGIYTWNQAIKATTLLKWKAEVFTQKLSEIDKTMDALNRSGAVAIWPDFDHVVPDWDSLMRLGFVGIRQRARNYRAIHEAKRALSREEQAFFDGIEIEYTAIIDFVDRLYHYAEKKNHSVKKF